MGISSLSLRSVFDRTERLIGGPLEAGTDSTEFRSALIIATRLRRGVGRRVDSVGSALLHQLSLPSHADVRALRRQIGGLERELAALRRELDERGSAGLR
jgi:hypothetical protein